LAVIVGEILGFWGIPSASKGKRKNKKAIESTKIRKGGDGGEKKKKKWGRQQ